MRRCSDLAIFVILQKLLKVDHVVVHYEWVCLRFLALRVFETCLVCASNAVLGITLSEEDSILQWTSLVALMTDETTLTTNDDVDLLQVFAPRASDAMSSLGTALQCMDVWPLGIQRQRPGLVVDEVVLRLHSSAVGTNQMLQACFLALVVASGGEQMLFRAGKNVYRALPAAHSWWGSLWWPDASTDMTRTPNTEKDALAITGPLCSTGSEVVWFWFLLSTLTLDQFR